MTVGDRELSYDVGLAQFRVEGRVVSAGRESRGARIGNLPE